MSIYDFINSPDIREHWEQIGYKPSPLEMAWLIWQDNHHTLSQKDSAYWTLIDNTDDCPIPAGLHGKGYKVCTNFLFFVSSLKFTCHRSLIRKSLTPFTPIGCTWTMTEIASGIQVLRFFAHLRRHSSTRKARRFRSAPTSWSL